MKESSPVRPSFTRVRVAGFRSLRDVELELSPITVLIGPNGAGKSNLLWALEMVRMLGRQSLQLFVGERGGATYLLHYGPQNTAHIDLVLEFATEGRENLDGPGHGYSARLGYAANESLIFQWEKVGFREYRRAPWAWEDLGTGHRESKLIETSQISATANTVGALLRSINFYHFHDTSRRSALRTRDYADASGDYLRSDGSNLATFLDGLRASSNDEDQAAWRRIMFQVTSLAPFIKDLTPVQDRRGTALQWVDERGATFGPAHLSDGTLRAIALFAALEQPRSTLPLVSCFDEPELGLHPAALAQLAGAVRGVASDRQVIVATQSPALLDHFEPNDVVVVERQAGSTTFKRLEEERLRQWLDDYRLSEVYESNLIGGRP